MLKAFVRLTVAAALFSLVAVGVYSTEASALEIPARPRDIPIVDQTNTLDDAQKGVLAQQIADERAKSGNQIAIVIIPSLQNDSLEDYSLRVARDWGVGTGENNNGVLLLIVKDDRKLRIEVGSGLEGALTDVQANRIIQNEITPSFKQERYYDGIKAGLTSIIAAIHGEYTAAATEPEQGTRFPWEYLLIFGFVGLSWLSSILARTKSWWAGGALGAAAGGAAGLFTSSLLIGLIGVGVLTTIGLIFDKIVSANYRSHAGRGVKPSWWAGGGFLGGGKGGSGGGFGGFGGGGFSGGGSSGSW